MNAMPNHLRRILDLARWAPSGDNTQPWLFEILDDEHILVHGLDTRDRVVYDLDGHASQLAIGAMLETMAIAASAEGRATTIERRPETPETHMLFDVRFHPEADMLPDPLLPCIKTRVVQRRPLSTQPLSSEQKQAFARSLPEGYDIVWFEGLFQRWRFAKFMFNNAKVRLTIPEAYEVHKSVIEWGARFSADKIPDQALGVDRLTVRFMRWAMVSWSRVCFFNTYLLGHLLPRLQMDLLPSLRCGAHFALLSTDPPVSVDNYLAAGRALQRFWLTATHLGWLIQPEMTPVIFGRYHRRGLGFTQSQTALAQAGQLNESLVGMLGVANVERLFFMGRIGTGSLPRARSLRKELEQLVTNNPVYRS